MKNRIILIIIFLSLHTLCISQNMVSDYVKHLDTIEFKLKPLHSFVMEWYGTKYKLGGNTKRGIDCSQFSKKLYWEVYGRKLGNNCYEQWKQTVRVPKDSLVIGDIVFFRSRQSPSGWHCGVYIGKELFVHASNRNEGVKISSLRESMYLRSYRGSGRLN